MKRIQGLTRQQIEFSCLEDGIGKDNPVSVMDAFIEKLDLQRLGFVCRDLNAEGRPAFEKCAYRFKLTPHSGILTPC